MWATCWAVVPAAWLGQLPPAVLDGPLGLNLATAVRWIRRVVSDWAA